MIGSREGWSAKMVPDWSIFRGNWTQIRYDLRKIETEMDERVCVLAREIGRQVDR